MQFPQQAPTAASSAHYQPRSQFALLLSTWLRDHNATKASTHQRHNVIDSTANEHADADSDMQPKEEMPSWVFEDFQARIQSVPSPSPSPTPAPAPAPAPASAPPPALPPPSAAPSAQASTQDSSIVTTIPPASDVSLLIPDFDRLTTSDPSTPLPAAAAVLAAPSPQHQPRRQQPRHLAAESPASYKRSQAKFRQPWRRTRPEFVPRKVLAKRLPGTTEPSSAAVSKSLNGDVDTRAEPPSAIHVPHDILLAIFSYLPARAYAQQYYDRQQPSELVACSRVNMAWRIAALSTIWQAILLPDPMDRSCRRLLHFLASSYASANITGKNYNITEIIQRVEVDLLEATEFLAEERDFDEIDGMIPNPPASTDVSPMADNITTLLQFVAPFRTLSIQLPQEIESSAAEVLTMTTSLPTLEALTRGIQDAQVKELDMPSPMYCSVSTFPGMLNLISNLRDLKVLILGYSSRDWPLLRAVISLPLLENLCVFDSSWSNQIWIYLLSSLSTRLRGLTVIQGRRPLEGVVLRQGLAPHCRNLTSLSIPFIQLMSGPTPVLRDDDVIPVIKMCPGLQTINIAGQRLLSDAVLEVIAGLWGLQTLDIRDCSLMTGQNVKSVRWQSIQRVRMFGCGEISQEFMDLILQAWRNSVANVHRPTAGSGHNSTSTRFSSVLDFKADLEDPVEMGWVRQREDEPLLDLDEDHFFADWYK
ncbi:hypothetical protein BGZ99_008097 [Dissophora globulifera]|uniref:F-box domain-containing protein n=1 Tax=Dissophora globulifera TaxID=979702 RepID=A0A9P6RRH2_9FUNG|nr:hypothetical protein BGZ99_008097 [Dissophora globulifera]